MESSAAGTLPVEILAKDYPEIEAIFHFGENNVDWRFVDSVTEIERTITMDLADVKSIKSDLSQGELVVEYMWIVTGQPSDRLGEDFTEQYKDFTERLSRIEELAKSMIEKSAQGMADQNKALLAAKTDEEKDNIKTQKQKATQAFRSCKNVLAMAQPLHSKSPSFIGNQKIMLSWTEAAKLSSPLGTGQKRSGPSGNGSSTISVTMGRVTGSTQLANKAFEDLGGGVRGANNRGRGRGWRRRGSGRGYY